MWLFKRKKAEPVISEHYALYSGAFLEEFEREGKASFFTCARQISILIMRQPYQKETTSFVRKMSFLFHFSAL